jgi:hypothetical protein
MDIFQDALLIASVPEDVKIILVMISLIAMAVALRQAFRPAPELKTVMPICRFRSADYWIRRHRPMGISYRYRVARPHKVVEADTTTRIWPVLNKELPCLPRPDATYLKAG